MDIAPTMKAPDDLNRTRDRPMEYDERRDDGTSDIRPELGPTLARLAEPQMQSRGFDDRINQPIRRRLVDLGDVVPRVVKVRFGLYG